jgi:hypothetical protein
MIHRILNERAAAAQSPSTMESLCHQTVIRRNPRNVSRVLTGQYDCSDGFKLALATALGVPLGELFPDNRRWLARATHRLCANGLADRDAEIYAALRAMHPVNRNGTLDDACAQIVNLSLAPTPDAARSAVDRVLSVLEPKLARIDADLKSRER